MEEGAPSRARRRLGALVVVVAFVASRVALWLAGVDFDVRPINDSFALVDAALLRDDLFTTLVNLHVQPPLFNLAVGLGLKLGPAALHVFHAAFLGLGLVLALGMYAALIRVGAGVALAVVATTALVLSPSVFLYEHWFHYDYPVAALLCLALVVLQRYAEHRRPLDACVFLGLLTAVALTRSMFHLAWLGAWATALVLAARHDAPRARRGVAAAAVLGVAAVAGVYANSQRVSGQFTSSTTMGVSLAKITTFQLDEEVRSDLVAQGKLSPLALVDPASPLARYRVLLSPHPPTGVPALDEPTKGSAEATTPFRSNFNNRDYAELSDRYLADAVATVRLRPAAYLQGVLGAVRTFFRPPSTFFALAGNRERVDALDRVYGLAVLAGTASTEQPAPQPPRAAERFTPPPGGTAWLVVGAYGLALVGGAVWVGQRLRRRRPVLVVAFSWSTVAYVTAVGNLLEIGENNRFRLYSDPLVVVLVVAMVLAWRRRRRVAEGSHTSASMPVCHAARMSATAEPS